MIDGAMQTYSLTLNRFLEHAAKWHPHSGVATGGENGTFASYADILVRAHKVSAVLRDRGTSAGSRVATLAWNTQHHVEVWYGVMGMGAVCHTLNPRLTVEQLADMVVQSEAEILVTSADLLPMARQIAAAVPALAHVLVIDGGIDDGPDDGSDDGAQVLEALLQDTGTGVIWGEFPETTPSGLCFTSGSTGAPKGVMYSHRSGFMHTMRLLQADMAALRAGDVVLPVVPMFHANAWGFPFAAPAVGAKLAMPGRRTDGASLARLIVREGVTVAIGVPTVWLDLCDHVETTGIALTTLERITVGGASIAPALLERIERTLGVTVQTSWGMTEMSPVGVFAPPADPERRAEVSGRPAIGVDLMLADAAGHPLPEQRNCEGHLHVRGWSVVDRYFGNEASACGPDGWFDTGDLAQIDDGGNLTITGRAKDLIKSGGEWINPAEIETVVGCLPAVSIAAVIGRSHIKWGERPLLLVELREGQSVSDQDILGALKGRVASWWIPDAVVRVAAMPLASTGKIDKPRLRSLYGSAVA